MSPLRGSKSSIDRMGKREIEALFGVNE